MPPLNGGRGFGEGPEHGLGIDQVSVLGGSAVEVLARQLEAQVAGERAGTVIVAVHHPRLAQISIVVQNGAGQFGIVRP